MKLFAVVALALALALALSVSSGCAAESQSGNRKNAEAFEKEGAAAVAEGDYARAVKLALPKALAGDPEYEFAVGSIQLQWLEDPRPKSAPTHTAKDALVWIYKAARAQVPQAAGILREGYEWGRFTLPKNVVLAECWRKVERSEQKAAICLAAESK